MAEAFCKLHGLQFYIEDAAQLLLASPQACDVNMFMAEYLSSVVGGQHVLWRHHAYVSATHHSRKVFLACVRRILTPTAAAGRLSLNDVQSLLMLLCPDFPLTTVKNAWSSAVAIQAWSEQAKQQVPAVTAAAAAEGSAGQLVQLQVFLQCFEVTYIYEQYLMAIRSKAFTQDKRCVGMETLAAVMTAAAEQLPSQGWPVPAAKAMKRCMQQASRAGTYPDFAFVELVKAMCSHQDLVQAVRRELAATAASAAAAAAANSVRSMPDADRPTSSLGSSEAGSDEAAAPPSRPWR